MHDFKLKFCDEDATPEPKPGRYSDKRVFDVLQAYLEGKLSMSEAAKKIITMLPEYSGRGAYPSEFSLLGSYFCQMARQIPYQNPAQTRLVQLIQHVCKSPRMNCEMEVDGYAVIGNIESFKWELRDWYDMDADDDDDVPVEGDPFAGTVNYDAFLARLTQSGFIKYSSFHIWTMRRAFEEMVPSPEGRDVNIRSAAVSIVFAGQAIYTQVVESPPEPHARTFQPGKSYSGAWTGLERWRFWKQGLVTAAANKENREDTRRLTERAANLMSAIEESMQFD